MKTLAAILVEQKKPLVLDEVGIPPLRFGQVLVEIAATRICGSQLGEIEGVKGPDCWLPHLLGHEGGGTVLEVGPEVTHVKPGDRVVMHWRPGLGLQPKPAVYDWNGKATNAGPITTFQRLSVVAENRLTVVPADTDFELCCLLADTLTTGFGTITNDARVRIGESVVIIGCGGIGLGAVLGASLAGACPVIAVDIVDHKLEKAKQYGATHTINSKTTDFRAAAEEILKGKADVVIDGTGNPGVLQEALALTAPKGRCVGIGVMPYDRTISINTLQFHFGKELTGSEGGSSLPAIDIPRQLRMIQHGRFDPKGMVSHRLKLEEVNDGIARMRSGETIHSIIHL